MSTGSRWRRSRLSSVVESAASSPLNLALGMSGPSVYGNPLYACVHIKKREACNDAALPGGLFTRAEIRLGKVARRPRAHQVLRRRIRPAALSPRRRGG